ncbi:hypothetical protein AJ80_08260 [Polytolypa hystricis UAMH7299]|uniref:Uncharacterized protein n=1 Tax=Polytolypa hystricis (strain UAMH7299) TaxID=1447883 RepID=A0A2B7XBC9_POLH7|nr:hypothetical protein AJ80_08260 [Polytolypa hystricis UAMH7299]
MPYNPCTVENVCFQVRGHMLGLGKTVTERASHREDLKEPFDAVNSQQLRSHIRCLIHCLRSTGYIRCRLAENLTSRMRLHEIRKFI